MEMKEEPHQYYQAHALDPTDDDNDNESLLDTEVDIKHHPFPSIVGVTNPLLELEADEPDPGQSSSSGLRFVEGEEEDDNDDHNQDQNSVVFLNENDEDVDEDEELAEITAVINGDGGGGMELEVQDVKPVAIPIPMTRPNLEGSETEIIINHPKKRIPEGQRAKPKPCICTICHTGYPSQQLFQLHMSNVHADERPHHCPHCGKGFAKSTELARHARIHDPNRFKGEPKFQCDLCDKRYHLKASLKCHRRITHLGYKKPNRPTHKPITQHHSIGVRNKQAPKKEVQVYKCPYCDLKYGMRCLLSKHLRCHTGERPYECKECGHRFATNSSLHNHVRNRHLNPSSNPRPSRPSFMYCQPCPCSVCGKVFKVPSQLQKHSLLHTGEKPHECGECGERFRLSDGLRRHKLRRHRRPNELEAFKCRICGKDGIMFFAEFQSHRLHVHRHIPFDSEREKSYGCGVCGKPYYLKGQAMVCALLKHDPTTLLEVMFKYKCPACPEERFGHHSTLALRRHWEKDHLDKPLPVRYRAPSGMYTEEDNREDILPNVRVNKELAKKIQTNGPIVKSEFPLYTELGLLPVEHKFYKDLKKMTEPKHVTRKPPDKIINCHICGVKMASKSNLKRHLRVIHVEGRVQRPLGPMKKSAGRVQDADRPVTSRYNYNCSLCGKRFGKMKTLRFHERQHAKSTAGGDDLASNRGRGRPRKFKGTEEVNPESKQVASDGATVNVNDVSAIRSILGNRVASVDVNRIGGTEIKVAKIDNFNNGKDVTVHLESSGSRNKIKNEASFKQDSTKVRQNIEQSEGGGKRIKLDKVLSIVLKRVDD